MCKSKPSETLVARPYFGTSHMDGTHTVETWSTDDDRIKYPDVSTLGITLVEFPVAYYQHFHYGPELMAARSECIQRLCWDNSSHDLYLPPVEKGKFSLLSQALRPVAVLLRGCKTLVTDCELSGIKVQSGGRWERNSSFGLYFNHATIEFYHVMFYRENSIGHFDGIGKIDIETLPKLVKWAKSFEAMKRRQYKSLGIPWFGDDLTEARGCTITIAEVGK